MKKLLLLFLFCPLAALAEFYPGTITMNDGTAKTGFVEIPGTADKNKVAFRADKKGSTEKFSIEDVKMFTVTLKKNEEATYYALKLANIKTFKKEYKVDKDKSWVRMIVPGKVNIVAAYFYSGAVMGAVASTASSGYGYFFWRPENDYCTYFHSDVSSGLSVTIGAFKTLKKFVEINFEQDCPQLAELLVKDDIKKNGLKRIVELYEKNCGK